MKKIVIENGFEPAVLYALAQQRFFEVPKGMTLMQHTMLVDTTEVYCIDNQGRKVQIFVPKQRLYSVKSKNGGGFLFLRIALKEGEDATNWLMVYYEHRQGVLLPENLITFDKRSLWEKVVDFVLQFLPCTRTGRTITTFSAFFV